MKIDVPATAIYQKKLFRLLRFWPMGKAVCRKLFIYFLIENKKKIETINFAHENVDAYSKQNHLPSL